MRFNYLLIPALFITIFSCKSESRSLGIEVISTPTPEASAPPENEMLILKVSGQLNYLIRDEKDLLPGEPNSPSVKLNAESTFINPSIKSTFRSDPVKIEIENQTCPNVFKINSENNLNIERTEVVKNPNKECNATIVAKKSELISNRFTSSVSYILPITPSPTPSITQPSSPTASPSPTATATPTPEIIKTPSYTYVPFLKTCKGSLGETALTVKEIFNYVNVELNTSKCQDVEQLMLAKKEFILSYTNISDLSPLYNFKDLEELSLIGNNISDIKGISELKNLRRLNLSLNKIKDLTPLYGLENLEYLNISENPVFDLNILTKLTNLKRLIISGSVYIPTFESLEYMKNLKVLTLTGTNLTDKWIPLISKLTALESLDISRNPLKNLAPLSSLVNLKNLYLQNLSQLQDISFISTMKNLETLTISDTSVSNIDILTNLSNLKMLDLSNTNVRNLGAISKLPMLKFVSAPQLGGATLNNLSQMINVNIWGGQCPKDFKIPESIEIIQGLDNSSKIFICDPPKQQ